MKLFNAATFGALILALQASAWPAHTKYTTKSGILCRHDETFTPDIILRVSYEEISIACTTRRSALINGTLPGPEVRIPPGKTTWIRVYNDIPDKNTSMHWHGLSQRTAIFSDGTPSASQWPIPPMHFFDYEVHPEPGDAGTYFYHSHVGFQMSTASGALIVEDEGKPPYEYDEERVILLGDYFNRSDAAIETGLTSTPFVWSGEVNAVLINGEGTPMGNKLSESGATPCQTPAIHVDPGKTYRFRIIGATSLSMVRLEILDQQYLKIIAADGQYTKPSPVKYMQVSSGQRYDVLYRSLGEDELRGEVLTPIAYQTLDREEGECSLNKPDPIDFATCSAACNVAEPLIHVFTDFFGTAYLRYSVGDRWNLKGDRNPTPSDRIYDWLEYALEPLYPNNFPTAAEVTRRVVIYARQLLTDTAVWQLNGDQWNDSTIYRTQGQQPYLVDIYRDGPAAIPNYGAAIQNSG